ncbi:MAG: TIGR04255 family protein [Paracoccaceae bacterium]|nr:TIGR04255 family protein [Paracoccaceae bacterium]MDE2911490.1 TIGR04255 family protein [Paracoccaceae bacterium]
MTEPQPLNPTSTPEVSLPRAPLARVLAQARFPTILAIRDPDRVADFQDAVRESYPNLNRDQVHSIRLVSGEAPDIRPDLIWRFTDRETGPGWRVSLGVDFVALETSSYGSRSDFLDRLLTVLSAVEESFRPASASRLGLRYIDRLTGEAVDRLAELVHAEVLGIIQAAETLDPSLRASVIHQLTEVQFMSPAGTQIQGRWGQLPANATYEPNALEPIEEPSWVLDLDMFTTESRPFASEELLTTTTGFAECLYWLFRQMVTIEFLKFYGGEP